MNKQINKLLFKGHNIKKMEKKRNHKNNYNNKDN